MLPPYLFINICGGFHAKFQVSRTNNKKPTPLFPKVKTFFYEIEKNKVCLIKMFAKQKSYLIIDIEKQKKNSGVSDAQEKVISFLIFNILCFTILNINFNA